MHKKRRDQHGIVLFEVLLAVLILSFSITASLVAFRHIIDVAKRSQEYFESRLVMNGLLFELLSSNNPDELGVVFDTRKEWHTNSDLDRAFSYKIQTEDIEVPQPEQAESEIEIITPPDQYVFKKIDISVLAEQTKVRSLPGFVVYEKMQE